MQIVDQVRHLGGLKGNFKVSEKEYLAPSSPYENTKIASRLFYSNLKDIVEQQHAVRDIFRTRLETSYKIRMYENLK